MTERLPPKRLAFGLAGVALALLLLPLLLNVVRGGSEGVGYDPRTQGSELRFAVSYAETAAQGPLSGELYVIVSRSAVPEPRLQLREGADEPWVVHRRVISWRPRRGVELTDQDPGVSIASLAHLPPGHWFVQGVLHVDRPEGAGDAGDGAAGAGPPAWAVEPGNLVSRPVGLYVDPRGDDILRVYLAHRIAADAP